MKRLIITLTLCVGCFLAADAQTTFTEKLQKSNADEGKITVTHTKEIDDLVNGVNQTTPTSTQNQTQPATVQEQKQIINDKTETITLPDTLDGHKKVMKGGYKINGYRVQVFAGGNSRNDRIKAERTGDEMKSLFPEEPVYVHFYSPRWICRIGNYRTYEEAHEVLRSVKNLGYQSAVIVKGKITVQYP